MRLRLALLATLALMLVPALPAHAADPGRWRETGRTSLPLRYYQGVTHSTRGDWLFDGVENGLWRTDRAFHQTAGVDDAIPPDVTAREGYNHIGDISFDRAEGGRVILPMECYYPGGSGDANTCKTGSFGVADPVTLAWRYYVKLDPAEIPKAMWAEVSPDGKLIWTSAGGDLLAYRASDVSAANAAPGAAPIRAVRRLTGAVPPSGITGAAFYRGRLVLAGSEGDRYELWSVDPANGRRRLEVERTIQGESEGLDTYVAAGGTLHWLIEPLAQKPTYGTGHGVLLHFSPAPAPGPSASQGKPLRLSVKPRQVKTAAKARFAAVVRTRGGAAVRGATVTLAGHRARTDRRGRAVIAFRVLSPGTYTARATRKGMRAATTTVRAVEPG